MVSMLTERTLSRDISSHNHFARSVTATLAADQLRAEVVTASAVGWQGCGIGGYVDVGYGWVAAPVDLQADVVRSATRARTPNRRDEGRAAALVVGTAPG